MAPFDGGSVQALAVKQPGLSFENHTISRRKPGERDVAIEIDACGQCHTDAHFAKNELGIGQFPLVPGHEIVGHVVQVGGKVKSFKAGDNVAVGCVVDSCESCEECVKGEEQYCLKGHVPTYGGVGQGNHVAAGAATNGGYSRKLTVYERFCIKLPNDMSHDTKLKMAPVLCAGITTYDPLVHHGVTSGWRVGVVGLGGLGQMGMKLARKMGATVVAISSSPHKKNMAMELGADDFITTESAENFSSQGRANSVDLVLDTARLICSAATHSGTIMLWCLYMQPLLDSLLKVDGKVQTLGIVGQNGEFSINNAMMIFKRRSIHGSLIGGMPRTQELCDFCYKHNVYPDIKVVKPEPKQVGDVLAHLDSKNSDPIRYVIDWTQSA